MTLANRITLFRFGLSLVALVILHFAIERDADPLLLDVCTTIVLVATVLDVVDGYVARRQGEVTQLGRVLDPLVDKILICGCLVFYVRLEALQGIIEPWVPAVIVVREFAVHAVRVDVEERGVAFGASLWGKQKTFLQTVAVVGCLLYASHLSKIESWNQWRMILLVLVGLAVASTVVSGIIYAVAAVRALRGAANPRG
jgi:CDP-diacylglycerol--glycerol-3-phosphate 3-phosphatidyltransferase